MKRSVQLFGASLFILGLAACGAGGGLLDTYTYWDSLCDCWVYESVATPPLFADGFESGLSTGQWVAGGAGASIDTADGTPAPALLLDGTTGPAGAAVTTAVPFPLANGLQIGVTASLRGAPGRDGGAAIQVRDAVTGDDVASLRVAFAADGSALVTYSVAPPGAAAVEVTEAIEPGAANAPFRQIVFAVGADGSATWLLDRVPKAAFAGVLPSTAVFLTLEAVSAEPRFDSVLVMGHD